MKGLYVQRIPFYPMFWENLMKKIMSYCFTHFIKFVSAKQYHGDCQVGSDNSLVLQIANATTSQINFRSLVDTIYTPLV